MISLDRIHTLRKSSRPKIPPEIFFHIKRLDDEIFEGLQAHAQGAVDKHAIAAEKHDEILAKLDELLSR